METEGSFVVAREWEMGKQGVTDNEYEVSWGGVMMCCFVFR